MTVRLPDAGRRRRARRLMAERRAEAWWSNLGDCPYARGVGSCGYGCTDEPACLTCAPGRDGWPAKPYAYLGTGVAWPAWLDS